MSRGCQLDEEELEELAAREQATTIAAPGEVQDGVTAANGRDEGSARRGAPKQGAGGGGGKLCVKCRQQPAQVLARQREPVCYACLSTQLLSKFRSTARVHNLLAPGDTVALAYSGGAASSALLHLTLELRSARTDRPERGKVPFTLHILHVNEAAAYTSDAQAGAAAAEAAEAAVAPLCSQPGVHFHCVRLEDVFCSAADGSADAAGADAGQPPAGEAQQVQAQEQEQARRREQLAALLAAVPDMTGREDLLCHLRTHALLRAAGALGCGKLLRGDSATALAAAIVAAASKGRGYSLPGDVQLADARLGAGALVTVFPLRELSSKELALLAHHLRLPLLPPAAVAAAGRSHGGGGKQSINSLAVAFVGGLAAVNAGSTYNILNTIAKLPAFPWNATPLPAPPRRQVAGAAAVPADSNQLAQPREQQQQQAGVGGRAGSRPLLCPLCLAPLADEELPAAGAAAAAAAGVPSSSDGAAGSAIAGFANSGLAAVCCLSCRGQILSGGGAGAAGGAGSSIDELLPPPVQQRAATLAAAASRATAATNGSRNSQAATPAAAREALRAQIAEFLLDD